MQFKSLRNYRIQRAHKAFGNKSAGLVSVCTFQASGERANGDHWLAKPVAAAVTFVSCKVLLFTHSQEQGMSWITKKEQKSIHPGALCIIHQASFHRTTGHHKHVVTAQSARAHYDGDRRMLKYFPSCIFPPHLSLYPRTHAITEDVLVFVSKCNYNWCNPTYLFIYFFTPVLVNKLHFIDLNAVSDAGM